MVNHYSDCFYCQGSVNEKLVDREIRWKNHLYVIQNVPIGVCSQCGEKTVTPDVAKQIDRIIQENKKPLKTISVPVYSFG